MKADKLALPATHDLAENLRLHNIPEGRVAADGDAYEYQYALRDHPSSPLRAGLGSTRVMFKMVGSTATLIQVVAKRRSLFGKNHSYPFGMELSGPAFVGGGNPYRYNGKELNEDLGLNWLDYGARWYVRWPPIIGQF